MEKTGFVEIGNESVFFQVKGDGPALIFVHGWTLDSSCWDAQVAHFSKKYRTYAYDWRGMGKSSGATPPFTMEQLGEDLAGFIGAFGIENPIICGHSAGGAIALQYAATHPEALAALVLADTATNDLFNTLNGTLELGLTRFFALAETLTGHNMLESMMPNLEAKLYSKDYIAAHPEALAAWKKQFLSNSLAAVLNGLQAWEWRPAISKPLEKLRAPSLFLWGLEDEMIDLPLMQSIQAHVGGVSQLSTLRGAGHMSPVEVPELFNRVMDSFLEQHVDRAGLGS